MPALNGICLVLTIIGGINWLLVGLFRLDIVAAIFGGPQAIAARIVYIVVGLAALYCFSLLRLVGRDATASADLRYAGDRPPRV